MKNPNCEDVKVKNVISKYFDCVRYIYKIIIPQEESKQEGYICPHTKTQCDDECCVSAEDCHITYSLASGMVDCDEPKQEWKPNNAKQTLTTVIHKVMMMLLKVKNQ